MSGGVDSSVAALLLRDGGFDVVGVGLELLGGDGGGSCCGAEVMADARRVAEVLEIPFYVIGFETLFADVVIDYFCSSYASGETPNPCVRCNKDVKFDGLLHVAMGAGAAGLATGHYARVSRDGETGRFRLHKGIDTGKEQSYFLYSLTQSQLEQAYFPLGEMTKTETRAIARKAGLHVHDKPESQDVCFVDGSCAEFVGTRHPDSCVPGPVLDDEGKIIGTHRGIAHYTIGQRRGLGLGGGRALYVSDISAAGNSITVMPGDKYMTKEPLLLTDMNFVSLREPSKPLSVTARTRYRGVELDAVLVPLGDGKALLEFDAEREPVAPGQSAVLYNGDMVVAGGIASRRSSDG